MPTETHGLIFLKTSKMEDFLLHTQNVGKHFHMDMHAMGYIDINWSGDTYGYKSMFSCEILSNKGAISWHGRQ